MCKKYIAHVRWNDKKNLWYPPHDLYEHLINVAELAEKFAKPFSSDWAKLAGKWHDLGKYRQHFQDYIRLQSGFERENAHIENGKRAPHSTAGAIHAVTILPPGVGHILAYIIAGHHAGLPDWEGGQGSLNYRLKTSVAEYNEVISENIAEDILADMELNLPAFARSADTIALWIRMLFSCLVDADFLDTERYMQPDKTAIREQHLGLADLEERFTLAMTELKNRSVDSSLNRTRNAVYDACCAASEWEPGLFSLTVPTGGGKTLSSLAFALKHAIATNKQRIIYAIPFTSIIEQNADVFRQFLGEDVVLEHHSNMDVNPDQETVRSRLAAENWDAPLIVTTNVQLFESLYASRTSRCRKLHNIANSVIILDEAQQIPRDFHEPVTQVMQQLADHFNVSWVLCTATQPVLTHAKDTFGKILLQGLNNVREIIPNPAELAEKLKRVDVMLPEKNAPGLSWSELASQITAEECVLTIVNTRKQAKTLYQLLPKDDDNLHLSANMCAQHRTAIIKEIKERLIKRRNGVLRPLRVISTQLIEAGVDVDFPVVYRAMAGLDSIAQSAGRCNREGAMEGFGKVVVFKPEQASPPGFLRQGEDTTLELMASGLLDDPFLPKSFEQFFSLLNHKGERDKYNILRDLKAYQSQDTLLGIQFRTAAKNFRLIDNVGVSVIVPYCPIQDDPSPVDSWLSLLEEDASKKWIYKKLQRYTITLPESIAKAYQAEGCLDNKAGQFVLLEPYYHPIWGADSPDTLLSAADSVF